MVLSGIVAWISEQAFPVVLRNGASIAQKGIGPSPGEKVVSVEGRTWTAICRALEGDTRIRTDAGSKDTALCGVM